MNASCVDDFDCPGSQVCYVNVSWASSGSFCDCNTLYGVTGPTCEDRQAHNILVLAGSACVLLFLFIVFILVILQDVVHFIRSCREFKLNPTVVTWIYSTLALLFLISVVAHLLAVYADPNSVTLEDLTESGLKAPKQQRAISILVAAFVGFALLSALSVSLMWLEIVRRVHKFDIRGKSRVYRNVIIVIQIFILVSLIVAAATAKEDLALLMWMPIFGLCALTFLIGRCRLIRLLERNEEDKKSSKFKKTQKEVSSITLQVVLSLILFFVVNSFEELFTRLLDPRDTRVGEFQPSELLRLANTAVGAYFTYAILIYAHRNLTNLRTSSRQPNSVQMTSAIDKTGIEQTI